jgi:hypothetical protein
MVEQHMQLGSPRPLMPPCGPRLAAGAGSLRDLLKSPSVGCEPHFRWVISIPGPFPGASGAGGTSGGRDRSETGLGAGYCSSGGVRLVVSGLRRLCVERERAGPAGPHVRDMLIEVELVEPAQGRIWGVVSGLDGLGSADSGRVPSKPWIGAREGRLQLRRIVEARSAKFTSSSSNITHPCHRAAAQPGGQPPSYVRHPPRFLRPSTCG